MNLLTTIGTICFSVFAVFGIFMFLASLKIAFYKKEPKEQPETEQPIPASNDISKLTESIEVLTNRLNYIEAMLKDWGALRNQDISNMPDVKVKLSYPIGYESTEITNQK